MALLEARHPPRVHPAHPHRPRVIRCARGRLAPCGRPLVMGILNVTPDSFSDGGAYRDPERAVARALRMAQEGAEVIDIGGESTRPGAAPVPVKEELHRVVPVVARLAKRSLVAISIDTMKAEVAERALGAGAWLINDVSALRADPRMGSVIASAGAAAILMHMRGTPQTMQRNPRYRDVIEEIATFLRNAAGRAQAAGVEPDRILVDPGLGFGKTMRHNLRVLRHLERFAALGYPVVIGPSRKSFIGKTLGVDVGKRSAGTLACVAQAKQAGAFMVRVHEVAPAVQLLRMAEAIERA